MQSIHKAVLLHEVVESLVKKGDALHKDVSSGRKRKQDIPTYLDGTLGGAGHALAIAKAFGGKVSIIGFDQDKEALDRAEKVLKGQCQSLILKNENFRNLDKVLDKVPVANENTGISTALGKPDMILLDLGISSDELDNSNRGFTFQKDEPLLMTMGDPTNYPFTARDIVNKWDEEVIANIIFGYAEERFARRIARTIVNYREKKEIQTSGELAELVKSSVPAFYRRGRIHPATKTFQALRIAVNDELGALKEGLKKGYEYLNKGGRMAVISFHSLEDRIVKEFFREMSKADTNDEAILITKKPITASDEEILQNPRSRSAKLRVIEKGSA